LRENTGVDRNRNSFAKGNCDSKLANSAEQVGVESGAVDALVRKHNADLQTVVEAWPRLRGETKVGILALVKAAFR